MLMYCSALPWPGLQVWLLPGRRDRHGAGRPKHICGGRACAFVTLPTVNIIAEGRRASACCCYTPRYSLYSRYSSAAGGDEGRASGLYSRHGQHSSVAGRDEGRASVLGFERPPTGTAAAAGAAAGEKGCQVCVCSQREGGGGQVSSSRPPPPTSTLHHSQPSQPNLGLRLPLPTWH